MATLHSSSNSRGGAEQTTNSQGDGELDDSIEGEENTQYFEGLRQHLLEDDSESQAQHPEAAGPHQANPPTATNVKSVEKTNDGSKSNGNNSNENRATGRNNSDTEASDATLNGDKKPIHTAPFQPSQPQPTRRQPLAPDTQPAALCEDIKFASSFGGDFETQGGTQGGEAQFVDKLREELLASDSDDDLVEDSQPAKPVSPAPIDSTKDIGPKRGTFTAPRPHIDTARRAVLEGHTVKFRPDELRLLESSDTTGVVDRRENLAVGHAHNFFREPQRPNIRQSQQLSDRRSDVKSGKNILDESILLGGETHIFDGPREQLHDNSQEISQQLWKGASGGKSVFAPENTYEFVHSKLSQHQQESVERNSSGFVNLFGAGGSFGASEGKTTVGDERSQAANKISANPALSSEQRRQSVFSDRCRQHHREHREPEDATATPGNIVSLAGDSGNPRYAPARATPSPSKKRGVGSISEQIDEHFGLPLPAPKTKTMDDYSIPPQGSGSQTQENSLTYTTQLQAALLTSPTQALSQTQITQTQAKTNGMATNTAEASTSTLSPPTQTQSHDRTYEEDESGAVHLSLGMEFAVPTSPFGVSQDAGFRNLQLNAEDEPETPAPPSNPFCGEKSKLMGASQLFGATQSSPVDARLLESGGPRPSPGMGMGMGGVGMMAESSPMVQRHVQISSPAPVSTDVGSSFQPFDLSTQPHANRGRNARHIPHPLISAIDPFNLIIMGAEATGNKDTYADLPADTTPAAKSGETMEAARRNSKFMVQEESEDEFDREERLANEKRAKLKRSKTNAEAQLKAAGDAMTANAARKAEERRASLSRSRSYRKSVEPNARSRRSEEVEVPASGEARKRHAVSKGPVRKAKQDVEVPASGELSATAKSRRSSREKRRSRTAEEEYVAQSLGTDTRNTQGTHAVLATSQVVPSSQPEVVVDSQRGPSQRNISTQGDSTLGSNPDKVTDSFPDAKSKKRSQPKLNSKSSMVLPTLYDSNNDADQDTEDAQEAAERAGKEKISVPVTSSGQYLKAAVTSPTKTGPSVIPSSTADKGDVANNGHADADADDEVVPETSPAKPFAYDDVMRDTSPMMSFSEMRMTQDGSESLKMEKLRDTTPTRIISHKAEREKAAKQKTCGKVRPVKVAKQMAGLKGMQGMLKGPRGTKVVFTETGMDGEMEAKIKKAKRQCNENRKPKPPTKNTAKAGFADVADPSPESSPVRPTRRSTRRQPSDVGAPRAAIPKPAVEEDKDERSNDEPITRPTRNAKAINKKQSAPTPVTPDGNEAGSSSAEPLPRPNRKAKNTSKITASSDNEPAPAVHSPATAHKKKAKSVPKPAALRPSDDAPPMFDHSVSRIRQSVEQPASSQAEVSKTTSFSSDLQGLPCPKHSAGKVCNKYHKDDGYYHDEEMRALAMKRKGSAMPSTASPGGKEGAEVATTSTAPTSDTSRETSVFGMPSSEMQRLPPTATQGRNASRVPPPPTTLPTATAAPTNATGATTQYNTVRASIVSSSPLSDVDDEMIESLHTAQAEVVGARSRSGTAASEMSDAQMMPPPTVTRKLAFAVPSPPVAIAAALSIAPPKTTAKAKKGAKRSASAASIDIGSDTSNSKSTGKARPKKAAKTTITDTPSRPRYSSRSTSVTSEAMAASGASGEVEVVRDTPIRTSRSGASRNARNSRLSYQEPDSDEEWGASQMVAVNYGQHYSMDPKHKSEHGKDKATGELFKGMAFAVSYRDVKNPEAVAEVVADRLEIERLIKEHGGRLTESFTELFVTSSTSALGTPNVSRCSSANTSFASTTGRRSSVQPQGQVGAGEGEDKDKLRLTPSAEKLGFVAFIGDHYSRKSKFIQALALSLPCLSSAWIRSCIRAGRIVPWSLYLLAAGESMKLGGAIRSRLLEPYPASKARFGKTFEGRQKMLEGMGVLFLMGKKDKDSLKGEKKKQYLWLTRALGAREVGRVKDVGEVKALVTTNQDAEAGWDLIYVDDKAQIDSVKEEILGNEEAADDDDDDDEDRDEAMIDADADADTQPAEQKPKRRVRVVSDEFVVQSLILGCLEDDDGLEQGENEP